MKNCIKFQLPIGNFSVRNKVGLLNLTDQNVEWGHMLKPSDISLITFVTLAVALEAVSAGPERNCNGTRDAFHHLKRRLSLTPKILKTRSDRIIKMSLECKNNPFTPLGTTEVQF